MCRRAMQQPTWLAWRSMAASFLPPNNKALKMKDLDASCASPGSCQPPKKPDMVRWFGHARSRVTPRALGWLARGGEGCWRPHPGHA